MNVSLVCNKMVLISLLSVGIEALSVLTSQILGSIGDAYLFNVLKTPRIVNKVERKHEID